MTVTVSLTEAAALRGRASGYYDRIAIRGSAKGMAGSRALSNDRLKYCPRVAAFGPPGVFHFD
jgi:hypothetical protein